MGRRRKMSTNLIQLSSNELAQANVTQRQISQKEFEIKLVDINSMHLSNQDASTYFYNQQRKQTLQTEISNFKLIRDNHINAAIMYALTLAEGELKQRSTFSNASLLLASIRSFLAIQNISLAVSFPIVIKISSLSSRLQRRGTGYISLKRELMSLKTQLQMS